MGETGETNSVTGKAMLALWNAVGARFKNTVSQLQNDELNLKIGAASIGYMVRHNAEVEYMFTAWFFGKKIPEDVKIATSRGPDADTTEYNDVEQLMQFLTASQEHMAAAIRALPEEAWHIQVDSSPMGPSTPVEAIGRLVYHTGLHAGQISLIRKNAPGKV